MGTTMSLAVPEGQVRMGGFIASSPQAVLEEVPKIWAMKEAVFQYR